MYIEHVFGILILVINSLKQGTILVLQFTFNWEKIKIFLKLKKITRSVGTNMGRPQRFEIGINTTRSQRVEIGTITD